MNERERRVSDWLKFRCGDLVTDRHDAQVGRVEVIRHGAFVTVRWLNTDLATELPIERLMHHI
jgi:hypothetical protein